MAVTEVAEKVPAIRWPETPSGSYVDWDADPDWLRVRPQGVRPPDTLIAVPIHERWNSLVPWQKPKLTIRVRIEDAREIVKRLVRGEGNIVQVHIGSILGLELYEAGR